MSFLLNQIAQHKAEAPTKILYISFLLIPFSQHMKNVHRWCYIKRNVYNPPHNCSQLTIKEKVLNSLIQITETTF
jgi:hypothetical protein